MDVQAITAEVEKQSHTLLRLTEALSRAIVGQRYLIDRLILGLLAHGHVLVEGVPGLAKTTAVRALAQSLHVSFHRVQFTPDLLPADLIGTQVYRPKEGDFVVKKGPIFFNIVLADEINRAPAKVQSALLEAMQERQVTIGDETFKLPEPFLVMATQNPIEQEGTYPLPEAQVDRFMMKLKVGYPSKDEERQIMMRMATQDAIELDAVVKAEDLLKAREVMQRIYVDDKLQDYMVNIVQATREPEKYGLKDLKSLIQYGASPRGSIWLVRAARAYACMQRRGYVTPQDIKSVGPDILRHRVMVSYEAEAQGLTSDDVIARIFDHIEVP